MLFRNAVFASILSSLLAINLIHLVLAQENPAADIIKKSQENLQKFEEKSTSTTQPTGNQKVPVPSVAPSSKPKADFVNSNFASLFAKPNSYQDATVDLTGKVSNFPEAGLLQMYVGGAVSYDAVVHYNESFVFVQDDCVKVTGIVEENNLKARICSPP